MPATLRDGFLPAASLAAFLLACELKPAPQSMQAPGEYRSCTANSECILAPSSCNGCCQREAINRKDSISFQRYRSDACQGYTGAICDCCYYAAHAECRDGRCTQVVDSAKCAGP